MADETFETFKKCAVEVLQVSEDQVTMDAKFGDDLDADSLDLVELVKALEDRFGITISDDDLKPIESVGDAIALTIRLVEAKEGAPA